MVALHFLEKAVSNPKCNNRVDDNKLYKAELVHGRGPWKTKESLELATLQWVHWFNHQRLLEPIGYIPPAEAEASYWRQLAEKDELAAAT